MKNNTILEKDKRAKNENILKISVKDRRKKRKTP